MFEHFFNYDTQQQQVQFINCTQLGKKKQIILKINSGIQFYPWSSLNKLLYNYYLSLIMQTTNTKKKYDGQFRGAIEGERAELSMHSQGRHEVDQEGSQKSEKFFSFNQSFTNIEKNDQLIQEKTNSLTKIRILEEDLKNNKARSTLWEKTKAQIIALNKSLKLSSISLGCSDNAIMKEFFQFIKQILVQKDGKTKEDKTKVVEAKKEKAELFEKLVQSNKKKYELQQKIVQYEHQLSKLTDINESLREKSRAQSTERSSKIRQFHEQTLMTIQQKDEQLTTLQDRNNQLKMGMVKYQEQITSLKSQIQEKDHQMNKLKEHNDKLTHQSDVLKKQLLNNRQQQKQTELQINEIKEQMHRIVEENISIRKQLKKRGQCVQMLRNIIEDAKLVNQDYRKQLKDQTIQQELRRQQNISALLKRQQQLNKNLKCNLRFGINIRKKPRKESKLEKPETQLLLPSQEELLI